MLLLLSCASRTFYRSGLESISKVTLFTAANTTAADLITAAVIAISACTITATADIIGAAAAAARVVPAIVSATAVHALSKVSHDAIIGTIGVSAIVTACIA